MKNFTIIVIALILFSCEKSNKPTPPNEPADTENFVKEFTEFTYKLNLAATGYSSSDEPKIYQQHEYRLTEGTLVNGKYFYKIIRKSSFDYQVGSHAHDWIEMVGYYRYDFNLKRGEYYQNTSLSQGIVIMDFNMQAGDSFLVDDCSSIDDLNFVNESTEEIRIGNESYPVLKGRLVYTSQSTAECSYESEDQVVLTPYSPAPFMYDLKFIELAGYDWSSASFAEWQSSYCVTTIKFSRTNDMTGEVEYECTLKDDI